MDYVPLTIKGEKVIKTNKQFLKFPISSSLSYTKYKEINLIAVM